MGLYIRPGGARWSYSGFHGFRKRLAAQIGVSLDAMVGFGGDRSWDDDEALAILLNHSDCEGEITADSCRRLVPRLVDLTSAWDADDHDRRQVERLLAGMRQCIETGEPLCFA